MPFDPDAVMWSSSESERAGKPLLVLLHGYGSHEGDLFGLTPYLPLEFAVASVRAPEQGPMGGFQWYPIPVEADGTARLDGATDEFAAWLRDARGDAPSVGLLGFSQGGSISIQTLRRHPGLADYAVVLSGLMGPDADPGDDALAASRPPVFWGRGTADVVIDDARVARLAGWLPGHTDLTERVYEGLGHSVSEAELADVVDFLRARLA